MHKVPGSAWISLTIGEKSHWGKGIGKQALAQLELLAREAGAFRIELGVYAHNHRAQHLYVAAGFKEIGRVPKAACVDGTWWDDIRLEKQVLS